MVEELIRIRSFTYFPCQWKQKHTPCVKGNKSPCDYTIRPRHSPLVFTLILTTYTTKSLGIKTFHNPFCSSVNKLLRAD